MLYAYLRVRFNPNIAKVNYSALPPYPLRSLPATVGVSAFPFRDKTEQSHMLHVFADIDILTTWTDIMGLADAYAF